MARIAALMELLLTDHRKPREARNAQGRDASPHEEMSRRIASLPRARQGKVLDIRRQIAEGTYEMADRLDKVTDRILEAITS